MMAVGVADVPAPVSLSHSDGEPGEVAPHLPRGFQQRIAIAHASISEPPDVILIDEPTGDLDAVDSIMQILGGVQAIDEDASDDESLDQLLEELGEWGDSLDPDESTEPIDCSCCNETPLWLKEQYVNLLNSIEHRGETHDSFCSERD